VYHEPWGAWAFPIGPIGSDGLKVRLRAQRGDLQRVAVWYGPRYEPARRDYPYPLPLQRSAPLDRVASSRLFDYFEGTLHEPTRRVRYAFLLDDGRRRRWYGPDGAAEARRQAGAFEVAHLDATERHDVPDWARGAVFYQIFPERFCNGDAKNDPAGTLPWSEPIDLRRDHERFYGGDLRGVIQKAPHLASLGVEAVWLTPIFLSPSSHKYDTEDYRQIDPSFGDDDTFSELLDVLHRNDIRVVIDGVFNHSGERFAPFRDVLQHGERSRYRHWFHIRDFPVRQEAPQNFETYAFYGHQPRLNTRDSEVREYLLDVARHWTLRGVDGWRLDVANEVGHDFWRAFRQTVREANPNAFLVGEVWQQADPWLRGDQFDAVMNYPFMGTAIGFFAADRFGPESFDARLTDRRMHHPDPVNDVLLNPLGSHDTPRFATRCEGEAEHRRGRAALAAVFQLTYPGAPLIYYGDEIGLGLTGEATRLPMRWESGNQDLPLLELYRRLIALRRPPSVLRTGGYRTLLQEELTGTYAFARTPGAQIDRETADGGLPVLVVLHRSPQEHLISVPVAPLALPDGLLLTDALTDSTYPVRAGQVTVNCGPWQAAVLIVRPQSPARSAVLAGTDG
jgi:glycosidase